jgi:DNA-binding NtrC family response regulator
MVYVISSNEGITNTVKEALQTDATVQTYNAEGFLTAALRRGHSKESCVILDLSTLSDVERIITFTKSSPRIAKLPIIAIGSEDDHDSLPSEVRFSINGVVITPYTAGELAAVIASVCSHPLPEIKPEPPPV